MLVWEMVQSESKPGPEAWKICRYLPNYALPPYWKVVALEHGYQPCTVTATSFSCQVLNPLSQILPSSGLGALIPAAQESGNLLFIMLHGLDIVY